MQEAFTTREAIMGLFKDHKVENSFSDFFFSREDDLNILLPLTGYLVLRNLIFTYFWSPLNAIQYS